MNKPILAFGLIAVFCLASIINIQFPGSLFVLTVYGADSYENDITYCEIYQYNGSSWEFVYNFTSLGGSTRIHDSWQTSFVVGSKLNSSLASSQSQASNYTEVYMNITAIGGSTVWTNVVLNESSCTGPTSSYYWLKDMGNWTSNLPSPGVTYNCTIDFRPYY
jgi:hypothetical protein